MPFGMFLSHERFDANGALSGPVVFAIDDGPRNELLRDRFGDRKWFNLRMMRTSDGITVGLVPYVEPPGGTTR